MVRHPPRCTRTAPPCPATTLFRANRSLEKPGAGGLARQRLQPGGKRGTVHLVYAANMPSLWRLLLEHAWMAWLPALLALAAWLWMRTQRFGPWLPSPE